MTSYDDVVTFFRMIMDDSTISSDVVLDLFAQAEIVLALEKDWEVFKKTDTSITVATTDVFTTQHSLPSDFLYALGLNIGASAAGDKVQINFKDRFVFQSDNTKFAIDYKNSKWYLMGTPGSAQTAYMDYIIVPTYPVAAGTPPWPQNFRSITAFVAAGIVKGGIDADDINTRLAPNLQGQYRALRDAMFMWDNRLKKQGTSPFYSSSQTQSDFPLQQVNLGV